ncbi:MAG: 50S ribosomal protein L13 [Chitinophagaceae bacterium]|nr:MAG: 50S ribosomal protein L13 [Chitinophagaceae bacterium]
MNKLTYKTVSAKPQEVKRNWHIIDAENQIVGRISSRIATVLRGKHKASYTPHVDCGDFVIVINAAKVRFTGNKMQQKTYIRHTGYPGGQRFATAKLLLEKKPNAVLENAIKGMLPKNRLGRAMFKKLFLYEGDQHPHTAQKPQTLKF